MNHVVLLGRLTRDPEIRYTQDNQAIANYTLAVDRRYKRTTDEGGQSADFIRCVTFGKSAEFAEKYLQKGTKIAISGRIQTGSYKDQEGRTIYTTDVVVEEHDFAGAKNENANDTQEPAQQAPAQHAEEYVQVDPEDEGLPF